MDSVVLRCESIFCVHFRLPTEVVRLDLVFLLTEHAVTVDWFTYVWKLEDRV